MGAGVMCGVLLVWLSFVGLMAWLFWLAFTEGDA